MEFWRHRRRMAGDIDRDAPLEVAGPPDHRDAFAEGVRQGRREERARRRSHPVLSLLVVLVAVAGAAVLALAAREGSFSRGGQVVDEHISAAAGQAQMAGADAAARTGQALKDAGDSIQQRASEAGSEKR